MDLINDFRDKTRILALSKLIKEKSKALEKPLNIMEICGGHTHTIMKFGLPQLVGDKINFVHGPGCPVCVMPRSSIDAACKLASMENTIFTTLADMIRVPGSTHSLAQLRAAGHDIRALYSPLDALQIAKENPSKNVIFFAIGFETTTPMSAVLVEKTLNENVKNLFFHINHVTVPAPLRAIMSDEKAQIDGFLGPSHVSVIVGSDEYKELCAEFKKPIAISGFEPLDVMAGVLNVIEQCLNGTYEVYNEYARAVAKGGNEVAKTLVNKYFKPCDMNWRGLGMIEQSGMDLRDEFHEINAKKRFDCSVNSKPESKACICPQILKGLAKPFDCKVFGKQCTPSSPIGSCMVSGEGACAAYYKYARR